jgi:hypothetical protein
MIVNESSVHKILEGKQIFTWLQGLKFIETSSTTNIKKRIVRNEAVKQETTPESEALTSQFTMDEIKGLSDPYAFVNVDIALPHSYFGYKAEEKHTICTLPEKQRIKEIEQTKLIKTMEHRRKEQDQLNKLKAKSTV